MAGKYLSLDTRDPPAQAAGAGGGADRPPPCFGIGAPRAVAAPASEPPAGLRSGRSTGRGGGLEELSVTELRDRLASGKLTSVELTTFYLKRIAELNHKGPGLHAVIETNPDAPEARRQAGRRAAGRRSGGCCTAYRCWSRTTSPRQTGCTPPTACGRCWASGRRRTRRRWHGCGAAGAIPLAKGNPDLARQRVQRVQPAGRADP